MRRLLYTLVILVLTVPSLRADSIQLQSGNSMDGVVIEDKAEGVTLQRKSGSFFVPRSEIVSVQKGLSSAINDPTLLAPWPDVLGAAMATTWGKSIHQIPATVIDVGNLRNVPYYSYRAGGGDYEVNIYGDPDHPAGVEIGIYHELLKSPAAKQACQDFMLSMIRNAQRQAAIRDLGFNTGSKVVNGWTVEVTPETADDAYGGWWISVYSIGALDASRATDAEMKQITVRRDAIKAAATQPTAPTAAANQTSTINTSPASPTTAPTAVATEWTPTDLSSARPASISDNSGGGGSVYVHGYTRKDGTYVHSYTRSAPGFGSGRGHR